MADPHACQHRRGGSSCGRWWCDNSILFEEDPPKCHAAGRVRSAISTALPFLVSTQATNLALLARGVLEDRPEPPVVEERLLYTAKYAERYAGRRIASTPTRLHTPQVVVVERREWCSNEGK